MANSPLPLGEGQGKGEESSAAIIAAPPANLQYVWGLRSVNDLVLRDSDNGGGGNLGISGSGLGLRLYALQDANWNVVALVSASGAVQERFSYTAFGTATALNANFSGPYLGTNFQWTRLFAGMDLDAETGIYYDNARWYDPSLGVFVTADPAVADPNAYRYAGNNPVTMTDPSGQALLAFGGGIACSARSARLCPARQCQHIPTTRTRPLDDLCATPAISAL